MKEQLRQWYAEEREKISAMSPKQAVGYLWDYYKLWFIGLAAVIVVVAYLIFHYMTYLPENWFYACYANLPAMEAAEVEDDGPLYQAFANYAGYDLTQKNLVFDTNCYCKPSESTYSNRYYDKLVALIEGQTLDVLIMEGTELQVMGSSGRLMDLQGEVYTIDERWEDRLLYCENTDESYGKEQVPIAVDLSGSVLTGEDGPYPEGCAVAMGSQAPHQDQFEIFLEFLFSDTSVFSSEEGDAA